MKWLFHAHGPRKKQSLESFARCTTNTTKLISYFGNVIIAGFFHVGKFSNVFAPADRRNSYLYSCHKTAVYNEIHSKIVNKKYIFQRGTFIVMAKIFLMYKKQ
ncbi:MULTISPECIES: hypothetical protein [unclassified Acinetobacter]|uniref:hypothetical protein n=1 Tax=unclassified Acinetobacter TaxID=196816 RepID=UPI0015D46990|nr:MULTISPECIES: hypothetical protein [unclassified Acinetobacter]UUS62559.1 hypothetical protein MST17_16885 [Acinetobacter sp. YH16056_T]